MMRIYAEWEGCVKKLVWRTSSDCRNNCWRDWGKSPEPQDNGNFSLWKPKCGYLCLSAPPRWHVTPSAAKASCIAAVINEVWDSMGSGRMILTGENLSTRRKTCHHFSLSTVEPHGLTCYRTPASIMRRWRLSVWGNWSTWRKTCHSTTFPLQISRGLTCYRTRASVVRILGLTAWATARPLFGREH